MCHNISTRATTTFASPGVVRTTSDTTFSTTPDVPAKGANLFRFNTGHGSLHCGACHGAPHAEFPTSQPNDNVYSTAMQSYAGKIVECGVCHISTPSGSLGGPHNLHVVGQTWVSGHQQNAKGSSASQCTSSSYCHGSDYRGTALSQTTITRTFNLDHNGPDG